jgi:D-aminoacyl-tRNA deacylase
LFGDTKITQFLIVTSTEDIASMNIRENLLALFKFGETDAKWHKNQLFEFDLKSKFGNQFEKDRVFLGLTDEPLIFLNDLKLDQSQISPDLLILASRHRSEKGRPAFLIHSTGNWNEKADFGGNPQELSKTSAYLLKSGFLSLVAQYNLSKLIEFSIDIEVTHHGQTRTEKPLVFIELGSTEREWRIKEGGKVVAKSIIGSISSRLYADKTHPKAHTESLPGNSLET